MTSGCCVHAATPILKGSNDGNLKLGQTGFLDFVHRVISTFHHLSEGGSRSSSRNCEFSFLEYYTMDSVQKTISVNAVSCRHVATLLCTSSVALLATVLMDLTKLKHQTVVTFLMKEGILIIC